MQNQMDCIRFVRIGTKFDFESAFLTRRDAHYIAISEIIKETCRDLGLPYHELPYMAMIRSHFRFLKRMGTEPAPVPVDPMAGTPG